MLINRRRGVVSLVLAAAVSVAVNSPVHAGPQDDDTGAAPPVEVKADSNKYIRGDSAGKAWIQIDAAGSSGGALEPGAEQQAIKAAAAAAGVPDAASAGGVGSGSLGGGSASDGPGSSGGGATGGGGQAAPQFTECSWRAANLPAGAPEWQGNNPADGQLLVNPCNGQQTFVFVPNAALGDPAAAAAAPPPPPDPAVLAQQAYAELVPPAPTAHRSPDEVMPGGEPWTVVNLWTWAWVDRDDWVPLSRTVELRGVSATVTATPKSLEFDPGDGSGLVSCDGPGRPWVDLGDNSDPVPSTLGGCGYRYKRVSEGVQATTSIQYAVTWTSNTGAGGTLPDLAGSTTSPPFRVEQIQVVVGR